MLMQSRLTALLIGVLLVGPWVQRGRADQAALDAAHRLPEHTMVFVHVPDAKTAVEQLRTTGLGAALKDDRVRPVLEQLWGSIVPQIKAFEEKSGVPLLKLVERLPSDLTIALIHPPGEEAGWGIFFTEDDTEQWSANWEKIEAAVIQQGFTATDETIAERSVRVLAREEGPIRQIVRIDQEHEHWIVTSRLVAEQLLSLEKDASNQRLDDAASFRAIMTRCATPESIADLTWFIQPIGTIRAVTRGNPVVATGMALLPALGLDGVQALGGCVVLSDSQYEFIARYHLLLEPPRDGVVRMIGLDQGETEPEGWVPAGVGAYTTWHWNFSQTHDALRDLYDGFRGEGALAREIKERVSDPIGIDVVQQILPALTGRISQAVWYEQPISIRSQASMIGVELRDAEAFRPLLEQILKKWPDRFEQRSLGNIQYATWKFEQNADAPAENSDNESTADTTATDTPGDAERAERRRRLRRRTMPQPTVALLGNYLLVGDRVSVIEKAILTEQGTENRLRDELDFKLVASKLRQQISVAPGMLSFDRPEENLRFLYQLLQSSEVRDGIHEQREKNEFFRSIDSLLQENRLPAFSIIAQYLAPRGSLMANEESGIYYVAFGLRRIGSQ